MDKRDIKHRYKAFCYHFLGKKLMKKEKFENIDRKLKMANVKYTPEVYISVIITSGFIITCVSALFYFLLFNFLFATPNWIFFVLILTSMTGGMSFAFFPFVVTSKISNRKLQINKELPFILSELSILASTGLSPIKIFRSIVTQDEQNIMNSELKKIIYKIDIDGKDIITAISETAKESPSEVFRETLWDIANMIHQGGDLDGYLRNKADSSMQLKRDVQKEFIEKLGTYSELYISLVLVGVLFLGIAAFLIDAMGSTMGGITSDTLLLLLSFGLIPVAIIVINIIVASAYSKNE